jgi:hypothetical protein
VTTFALLHGAWCWERLIEPLRERAGRCARLSICAFGPLEGKSMADQFRESPEPIVTFPEPPEGDEEGRSIWPDEMVARRSPRERLRADPIELDAGHFPMLTAPDLLADALSSVA